MFPFLKNFFKNVHELILQRWLSKKARSCSMRNGFHFTCWFWLPPRTKRNWLNTTCATPRCHFLRFQNIDSICATHPMFFVKVFYGHTRLSPKLAKYMDIKTAAIIWSEKPDPNYNKKTTFNAFFVFNYLGLLCNLFHKNVVSSKLNWKFNFKLKLVFSMTTLYSDMLLLVTYLSFWI